MINFFRKRYGKGEIKIQRNKRQGIIYIYRTTKNRERGKL